MLNRRDKKIVRQTRNTFNSAVTGKIRAIVADFYNISLAELAGNSRKREYVMPRQVSIYLVIKFTDIGYQPLGRIMGRNHSSIMHSCRVVQNELEWNKSLASDVAKIELLVGDWIRKFVNGKEIRNDYYFIDLNHTYSIMQQDGKAIVFSGYEIDEIMDLLKVKRAEIREHIATGNYILEKKIKRND